MSTHDPAFQWETEALRESAQRIDPDGASSPDPGWVTLRGAHEATGIPLDTIRKWARRGSIPSRLDHSDHGERRTVDLVAVVRRAQELGRDVHPVGHEAKPLPAATGTMIVPIDAWEKMLIQLGNLHQAGQQLAEARERAAKAETESQFLRERLTELRAPAEEGEVERPAFASSPDSGAPTPPVTPDLVAAARQSAQRMWSYARERWYRSTRG